MSRDLRNTGSTGLDANSSLTLDNILSHLFDNITEFLDYGVFEEFRKISEDLSNDGLIGLRVIQSFFLVYTALGEDFTYSSNGVDRMSCVVE